MEGPSHARELASMREAADKIHHEYTDISIDAAVSVTQSIFGQVPAGNSVRWAETNGSA